MSPKVTISKGERVIEADLSDRQARLVAGMLNKGARDYVSISNAHPEAIKDAAKIIELETSLLEAVHEPDPT